MSMLWRKLRKRAFTLIELLVVIAIIALLAAILTPAISNALLKGRMTQVIGNGKGIYTLLFSQEMDNPLNLQSTATVSWPAGGQYTSSSHYFTNMVGNPSMGLSFNLFAAPGVPPARDAAEFINGSNPDGKPRNAWCIAENVTERLPATAPVLFTQNATLAGKVLNGAFSLNAAADPFGSRGCVVVQRGGAAFSLDQNTAIGTNFNMTGATNTILYPAGGQNPS